MKTLCIDTTSLCASVSIIEDKKVIGEFTINYIRNHSLTLMPLVENLLKSLFLELSDIEKIAITTGPGSFTGQRVGASTAIALAKSLNCPLVPINTLDMLKENCNIFKGIVVPIIDARRSEVYYSVYKNKERLVDYDIKPITEVLQYCNDLDEQVCFVGDGVLLHKEEILKNDKFSIANMNNYYQSTSSIAELLEDAKEVKYNELELFYIKKTEAERTYNAKNFKIVKLQEEHLDELAEIEKDSFDDSWSKKMLEQELNNKMAEYFVGMIDDKIIGYIGSWYVINEGQITNIAVRKEYRKQGFGNKLLQHLIQYYKDKDCLGITLEVRKSNENAIKLYEKFGFKLEGERKNYYRNGEDAHIMWYYFEEE